MAETALGAALDNAAPPANSATPENKTPETPPADNKTPENKTPENKGAPAGETPEAKAAREAAEAAAADEKKYGKRPDGMSDADWEKKRAEVDKAAGEKKDEGAPETYADFVMPEGVQVDAEALEAFKPWAKANNLSQAKAQEAVNLYTEATKRAVERWQNTWAETKAKWLTTAKADPELGAGDEKKFAQTLASSVKAVSRLGTPGLREALEVTGVAEHPEMLRFLARVGAAYAEEDSIPKNPKGDGGSKSAAQVMFPDWN